MNDDEIIKVNQPDNRLTPMHPSAYELLVLQSKKMGAVATKAFHSVRHILEKEVPLPRPEILLGNFTRHERDQKALIPQDPKKEMELLEAEKLKQMVKQSHEVLASGRTVWPVTLFPDSIVVDRTKISITKRDFFWTSNVISFQIEDVLNVSCAVGPLFGSLTIASRVMSSVDHFTVNYLWRGDAIFFKHLIQGHIIAKQNKLQTDKLTKQEMVETLCELGIDSDT